MKMSRLFKRTLVAMFLLFGIISTFSTVLSAWILYNHMTEEYISKGRGIARSIVIFTPELMLNRDASTMQSVIDQYLEIQGVAYVFVLDAEGEIISHTFVPNVPSEVLDLHHDRHAMLVNRVKVPGRGEYIDIGKPILAGVAGYVHVGMDLDIIKGVIWSAIVKIQGLLFVIFWGCVFLLYIVVKRISKPLTNLTAYAGELSRQNFNAQVDIQSKDEIGLLANTMQSMAHELSRHISGLELSVEHSTLELQDTLAYLEAVIENVADGLLVLDPVGKVTKYNHALSAMFDFGDVDLSGKNAALLFSSDVLDLSMSALQNPMEVFSAEVPLPLNRVAQAAASAVFKPSTPLKAAGSRLGTVILFRDITKERELDLMKTEFLTTVSHELRTPLTSILGFAKVIRKKLVNTIFPNTPDNDPKTVKVKTQVTENIGVMVAEGERLTQLINDVLDISKMESGRTDWRRQRLAIRDILEHSVDSTRSLYQDKPLKVLVETMDPMPEIEGDRDRLVQVMVNLISNAVKFTEQGAITCRARALDNSILVSVSDTGMGIPFRDKELIFERFKQAGNTLTDKPMGTGLGLPICKQIVEHHGGTIWVESAPGAGSTFFFTLPLPEESEA